VRYISKDSAYYARLFAERILHATRRLTDFPESGRIIPEAEDDSLREIIVQGYRIMYRHETDRVLILAVMNGRRDVGGQEEKPWAGA
jgi:plasmid stabilization system protein ParE